MRRIATLLTLASLAAACAPMQWARQDAGAEQIGRDEQECRQKARREAQNRAWMHRVEPVVGPGFVVWPSGATVDPFGNQLLEESRLTQFCMESKGYMLVPAPKK